jgi:hypothetical protein
MINAKKAKTLRKMLRANDVDPRHTLYTEGQPGRRAVLTGNILSNGQREKKIFHITGTARLSPECGRRVYQEMKRLSA